jgi:hypothetical protein
VAALSQRGGRRMPAKKFWFVARNRTLSGDREL